MEEEEEEEEEEARAATPEGVDFLEPFLLEAEGEASSA